MYVKRLKPHRLLFNAIYFESSSHSNMMKDKMFLYVTVGNCVSLPFT